LDTAPHARAGSKACAPLTLKPDLEAAAQRWAASFAGELIDRPPVWVTCSPAERLPNYYELVHGDIDTLIERALAFAEGTYWGGDAIPQWFLSFGPDELAAFCGGTLSWSADSPDTNWSAPFVEDWEAAFPLCLQQDHPLWQRLLTLYRRGAERMAGKMLLTPPDLHSNMDLLTAMRGPERLLMDLVDTPELVDRAMDDARAIFREIWAAVREAGRMDELGFCQNFYSMEGAAMLQCDFSCMISPAMYRRWVLPALEEEADLVRHATYHWDGPGALVHEESVFNNQGLYALSYVPGAGQGSHVEHLDLLKRMQAAGKVAHVGGTVDEIKYLHHELRHDRVVYFASVSSPDEAEALLTWLVQHT
jgi:5-methyltetrahydrofolate--homocysteine methyltransferase